MSVLTAARDPGADAHAAALTDPISFLEEALRSTPPIRSLHPDTLAAFHAACRLDPLLAAIEVDPQRLLADLAAQPVETGLTLAELLMALRQFELAIRLGEALYADHPMDHRVQDALFRARFYRKTGSVSDRPGRELHGLYCPLLWNTLHVLSSGNAHQCCSVWLRAPAGNVFEQSIDEIWRSPAAEALRDTARDGSYAYCGKIACPQIRWSALEGERDLAVIEDDGAEQDFWLEAEPPLPDHPRRLNLSYDKTCNLACPSCRPHKISAKGAQAQRIEQATDRVLQVIAGAERLEVTGSGDPFASKAFRRLLMAIDRERCPRLRITIMTNGLLLDRREWERFAHLHGMIDMVNVSVDAARPDTYRVVRRGGELADLLPNLRFIGELLADGAIANFRMCFVVQQRNYREMPEFVRMARAAGASQVRFQMLHDWGAMPRAELAAQRIHVAEHPEHAAFLDVLRSLPDTTSPRILSDFGHLLPRAMPAPRAHAEETA